MSFSINRIIKPFFNWCNILTIRVHGGIIGDNANIVNRVYFRVAKGALIKIGNNFTFTSGSCYNTLARNIRGCFFLQTPESKLIIGDNVGISSSTFWVTTSITIGDFVNIGADCMIMDTDCHSLNWINRGKRGGIDEQGRSVDQMNTKAAPVIIGNDVMIGARCIILKGVTIGDRAVIGAGSIVSHSIPSDCVAAGNPCKVVRVLNGKD